MSGLRVISKKLIFCIKLTYLQYTVDMNIPCLLFQQATVGVHYLVSLCQFVSSCQKTKVCLNHCISLY